MNRDRILSLLLPIVLPLSACSAPSDADDPPSGATDGGTSGGQSDTADTTGVSPGDSSGTDSSDDGSSDDASNDSSGSDSTGEPGDPNEVRPGIYRLDGLEFDLPPDDLAPLDEIIGDATYVGLGESTHTADGFLAGKARLSRYLIEHEGFRVVGLETPWVAMRPLNEYVQTCQGDPTNLILNGMFAVWADVNMLALAEWMCAWNQEHPEDPVSLRGWDLQQPWDDGAILQATLEAIDPDAAVALFAGIDPCNGVGTTDFDDYVMSADALVWSGQPADEDDHLACLDGIAALQDWLTTHEAEIAAQLSEDQLLDAQLALLGVEAWEGSCYYVNSDAALSYEARDRGNAQAIQWIREHHHPSARMVLWAHNAHLFRNSTVLLGGMGLQGAAMTGTWLDEQIGDDYRAIGLVGYDVDINWWTPYDVEPADGSNAIERHLHQLDEPYLLVDLWPEPEESPFTPGTEFDLGHPIQGIEAMVPGEQFDGLLFVDQSTGMNGLW